MKPNWYMGKPKSKPELDPNRPGKCVYCGMPVSVEEMRARYEELVQKYKIVPMLITTCKECREKQAQQTKNLIIRRVSR